MEHRIAQDDEILEKLGLDNFYILQKKDGYRFTIDPILLAGFAEIKNQDNILDLGTGGGILPFLLQKNNQDKNLRITGMDIQREYIEMAERSREINKIHNIEFILMDIKNISLEYKGIFHVVISNPPFFKANEGKISSKKDIAIAKHELEIDFRTIIKKASFCLNEKGRFIFIQRSERLFEIGELMKEEKMSISKLQFIYPNKQGESKLFLAEGVKRKNKQLRLMKPLIIYDNEGNYTEEVRCLYE